MTYGTIKVDTVTFTDAGVDKSVTLSGLVQNPTFSGNVTVTGTLSGVTVTGTTANFTSGNFTNISGGTHTITSGVFAAGSAASPSITFTGDLNTGIYSPGADQVAISTGGTQRLLIDASGNVNIDSNTFYVDAINNRVAIGTTSPSATLQVSPSSGSANFQISRGSKGLQINQDSDSADPNINVIGTTALKFLRDGSESARFDTSGRFLVGTSTSPSAGLGQYARISAVGYTGGATGEGIMTIARGEAATSMASSDTVGQLSFTDINGNDFAKILCFADGSPGSGDYPGALTFSTTADGASSPTERMRISSNGSLTVTGVGGSSHALATNNAERIRWNDNGTYLTTLPTTGSGANAHIWTGSAPANLLMLSTSSIRYKTDIEDLDPQKSDALLNFRPVWYRSLCELDNKDWSWYGLIAEEVAEIEPRLVHWTYLDESYEQVEEEDGSTRKQLKSDAELVPNGVQYDRLTVLLLDLVQRQNKRIETLEAKVAALEAS
jgi:hypothetical protein